MCLGCAMGTASPRPGHPTEPSGLCARRSAKSPVNRSRMSSTNSDLASPTPSSLPACQLSTSSSSGRDTAAYSAYRSAASASRGPPRRNPEVSASRRRSSWPSSGSSRAFAGNTLSCRQHKNSAFTRRARSASGSTTVTLPGVGRSPLTTWSPSSTPTSSAALTPSPGSACPSLPSSSNALRPAASARASSSSSPSSIAPLPRRGAINNHSSSRVARSISAVPPCSAASRM